MSQWGTDLKLVNRDIVFTPDGDIETVEGVALIAQDIAEEASIAVGSIVWDPDAGSSVPLSVNDVAVSPDAIIAELERIAIADQRVDPDAVRAVRTEATAYLLSFTALGQIEPETLLFDVADLFQEAT